MSHCGGTQLKPMYLVVPGQPHLRPATWTFEGEALLAVVCNGCGWLGWAEPESLS